MYLQNGPTIRKYIKTLEKTRLGKTHMAVGTAAGLLIMQPQNITELILGTGAAMIGSVISDIDIGTSVLQGGRQNHRIYGFYSDRHHSYGFCVASGNLAETAQLYQYPSGRTFCRCFFRYLRDWKRTATQVLYALLSCVWNADWLCGCISAHCWHLISELPFFLIWQSMS